MNDFVQFVRRVEEATRKRRGRRPVFNANGFYPHAVERSLAVRTKAELEAFIGKCTEAALVGTDFKDDAGELSEVPESVSPELAAAVSAASDAIRRKASLDFAEWSEMIVGKPYYPPEAEAGIFTAWEANFKTLCKSAEADAKKDVSRLLVQSKNEGWNKARLEREIKGRLPSKYKARAENIARTETGKLNSAAKLSQFREVGFKYYKWLTTIDGRERASHKAMNGLICSVSDPGVYFTENPDDPMHPVSHPRTAAMFRGNPGEDFQCRCSMVAWDPEIDGKYEIKESPAEEKPKEAEEKAEKEAQERAEAEKREKARAEQEKAAEALRNAKEEARRAEAERKAAERARVEAEKARKEAEEAARKAATEARKARLEAAAVRRHAARTPESEAATIAAWNARRIRRIAEARHAARTRKDEEKIKTEYWKAHHVNGNLTDAEKTAIVKNWIEIEKTLGIKKGKPMTVEEADRQSANPNYLKGTEFQVNCQTCAPAYMLRLWGFDVKAKGKTPGSLSEYLSEALNVFKPWLNADGTQSSFVSYRDFLDSKMYKKMTPNRYIEFFEEMCKDAGVYECTILWSGRRGAHATILQRLPNGRLVYIEPQRYEGSTYRDVKSGLADEGAWDGNVVRYFGIMRVDNKIFDKRFSSIFDK